MGTFISAVDHAASRNGRESNRSAHTVINDPATTGNVVPASFFGMHFSSAIYKPWPTVDFGTLRLWDQWPGVSWCDINPSAGVFNWANLDSIVNAASRHGVDVAYTFGYVPAWASSNPAGTVGGAPAGSCYFPDITAWKTFVTQITSRYQGKIKYWELWNEPNSAMFWSGTTAQLVTMCCEAYGIIKTSGGQILSPAPQGTNAHLWLDSYFAAGGAACTDIVSFHGYLYGVPELIVPLVSNIKSVMSKHGLGDLPLWDTEHSWGDISWPLGATGEEQSAWLARYIILSFTNQVARSFWYMFDSTQWGTLADQATEQLLGPGTAYQQVYKWIVGASVGQCTTAGDLYQCSVRRSTPYEALVVWCGSAIDSQTTTFSVPSGYTQYRTLAGETYPISASRLVQIGMKPLLLEKLA